MTYDVVRCGIRRIEEIARLEEHIAPVIESNASQRFGQRIAGFQVDDRQSVSAQRYRERIEENRIAVAFAKFACRDNNDTRPGRFEIEPSQGVRAARKETLADRH